MRRGSVARPRREVANLPYVLVGRSHVRVSAQVDRLVTRDDVYGLAHSPVHSHFEHLAHPDVPNAPSASAWPRPRPGLASRAHRGCGARERGQLRRVLGLPCDERLVFIAVEGGTLAELRVRRVGGHTSGQTTTTVALDAVQPGLSIGPVDYYGQKDLNRPYDVFADAQERRAPYDFLNDPDMRPDSLVVAARHPEVSPRSARVTEGCVDLANLVDAERPCE